MIHRGQLLVIIACSVGALHTVTAQTVQLPTTHHFGYSGSVLVPDGGTAALGSYGGYSQSSSQSGWLSPRSHGRSSGITAAGASVSATVIDLDQMDRDLLGQSATELRDQLRKHSSRPARTIHTIEEGKSLVRYARTLVKQGQYRGAKQAYLTALPLLDQHLRQLAQQELERVPSS